MIKKLFDKFDLSFLSILLLTAALYLGFSELINRIATESAREAVNAAIGVIFVIMTTMYMLKKQTEVDRKRDFDSEILKKKLATYERALAVWQRVGLTDGTIKQDDRAECLEVQLQVMMVAPKAVVSCAANLTKQINQAYSSDEKEGLLEEEKEAFFADLVRFSEVARKDLDLPETSLGMEPDFIREMITVVVGAATGTKKNYDKFIFNGKELGKSKLALEIVKVIAKDHNAGSFDDLRSMFPDTLHTEGRPSTAKNRRVVMSLDEAKSQNLRYHSKDEDLISLGDGSFAVVSNQWGTNVDYFIQEVSNKFGIKVQRVTSN
jgi:hypothetical protein